ncbi:MAG: hypothetical protein ABJO97_10980 [Roseibium sp.]|uniref:hypothetical protein n=1 Tax=Alphaproteobacteria TaxID=28211 RepID=UPI0032654018
MNYPLIGVISVFTFVLLATANAMIVPLDPSAICETKMCIVVRTFSEYQTLTGAGLAIFAAYIAARPAWLQLQKMRLQQDISARSAIVERLKVMEKNGREMEKEIAPLMQEIWRNLYDDFEEPEYDPASVNVHWAHDKSLQCSSIATKLENQQSRMRDTHKIDEARQKVIDATHALGNCFSNISAYASNAGDPEMTQEIEDKLQHLEVIGREELPDKANALDNAYKQAQSVIESETSAIRRRLRQIDDAILEEPK